MALLISLSLCCQNDEREQKARDFMRSEIRFHRAEEELKQKRLSIQDHHKKLKEIQIKLV